jgi:glycolate oxidase FAD binding subunit
MSVLDPATIDELSAILRDANAARQAIVPIGHRTTLREIPSSAHGATLISVTSLPAAIDHVPGDMVATLPAGVSLGDANRALARAGQCLPLDPPLAEHATIGGIVAANASGPRRHRYGAPRDLIIGISVMLADGRAAKAGGRVVKNVAGYDLSRLMCGSLGSLAVITSATFKLSPMPAASRTVVADVPRVQMLGDLLQALTNGPLTPSAIEVMAPPARLLIRFETTATAADHMARSASAICERHGAATTVVAGAEETRAWAEADASVWGEHEPGTILKFASLPTDVPCLLDEISTSCASQNVSWYASGRAALGVFFVRVSGDPASLVSLIADWRHRATVGRGSLVVVSAAPGVESVSRWGDPSPAMSVMRAVKARFDPNAILSPGMGPGGL